MRKLSPGVVLHSLLLEHLPLRCYGGPLDGRFVSRLELESLKMLDGTRGQYHLRLQRRKWPEWVKQQHPARLPVHEPVIWIPREAKP